MRDHQYDVKGEDHLRYMHYAARSVEESMYLTARRHHGHKADQEQFADKKVGELYSPGHTDLGTVTLLFRQPVSGLQILNSEGQWKYVKPQNATLTVNTCDSLTALTGGLIKSSIHRVHAPPSDQAHIDRLGVLYFARYDNLVSIYTNGTEC